VRKLSFWDVLAWIVLLGILLWLILKTAGIINTPLWLEYAPLYGAVYLAGWQIHKLDIVANEVEGFKKFRGETVREVNEIRNKCNLNHR